MFEMFPPAPEQPIRFGTTKLTEEFNKARAESKVRDLNAYITDLYSHVSAPFIVPVGYAIKDVTTIVTAAKEKLEQTIQGQEIKARIQELCSYLNQLQEACFDTKDKPAIEKITQFRKDVLQKCVESQEDLDNILQSVYEKDITVIQTIKDIIAGAIDNISKKLDSKLEGTQQDFETKSWGKRIKCLKQCNLEFLNKIVGQIGKSIDATISLASENELEETYKNGKTSVREILEKNQSGALNLNKLGQKDGAEFAAELYTKYGKVLIVIAANQKTIGGAFMRTPIAGNGQEEILTAVFPFPIVSLIAADDAKFEKNGELLYPQRMTDAYNKGAAVYLTNVPGWYNESDVASDVVFVAAVNFKEYDPTVWEKMKNDPNHLEWQNYVPRIFAMFKNLVTQLNCYAKANPGKPIVPTFPGSGFFSDFNPIARLIQGFCFRLALEGCGANLKEAIAAGNVHFPFYTDNVNVGAALNLNKQELADEITRLKTEPKNPTAVDVFEITVNIDEDEITKRIGELEASNGDPTAIKAFKLALIMDHAGREKELERLKKDTIGHPKAIEALETSYNNWDKVLNECFEALDSKFIAEKTLDSKFVIEKPSAGHFRIM